MIRVGVADKKSFNGHCGHYIGRHATYVISERPRFLCVECGRREISELFRRWSHALSHPST